MQSGLACDEAGPPGSFALPQPEIRIRPTRQPDQREIGEDEDAICGDPDG
jgi:hypothetical protein